MPVPNRDIPSFVSSSVQGVSRAAVSARRNRTKSERILRRYSIAEVAHFLGCDRNYLYKSILKHPDSPTGKPIGRENTFSVKDIMHLRAVADSRAGAQRRFLNWRKPGDPLHVISFSSQKGGVGKSLSSSHYAQYLNLFYGLRVGVIDADPQATCSQYFVDDQTELHNYSVKTYTDFMGLPEPGEGEPVELSSYDLDLFWRPTPWPGLRLIPGGASIQEADVALFFLARNPDRKIKKVYRMLRDTIERWGAAHQPRTVPTDFAGPHGSFQKDLYDAALTETLDVIIIDTPPSLTVSTLNTVVAADSLVVPQTMKGFDLTTLHVYLQNLQDYFEFIEADSTPVKFRPARSLILPTIVNTASDTDLLTIGELLAQIPDNVSKVFYKYSSGASNAFREFKSIYEYKPERARRESVRLFVENANAVNDQIVHDTLPHLEPRGFAETFIAETYPDNVVASWSGNEVRLKENAA